MRRVKVIAVEELAEHVDLRWPQASGSKSLYRRRDRCLPCTGRGTLVKSRSNYAVSMATRLGFTGKSTGKPV